MATVNFTTNLALALPTTGDLSGSWGTAVNTGISELVDQALGYQAFSATGGSDTLTIPDAATGVARSIYIQLNGTGGGTVNVPTTKTKMYFVFNNTASAITFKVTGQTGVSIPAAAKIALVSNGTDVIPAVNYFSTAISAAANTGSMIPFYYANQAAFPSAATSHGAIAHSHADNAMYFAHSSAWWRLLDEYTDVTVAQGGTGLSTLTANNVILGNGTSTPLFVAPSTAGNVLTSTGTTWASTAPAAGGVTTFTAGTTGFTPSTATSGAVTLAGTLATANGGTGATSATAAMASLMGFTTTATAAGTTTLTNTSSYYQQFTGTTTQTVRLPVTSTLVTGWTFHIVNNSTGNVSVQSSGANAVITVLPGTTAMCTCIGITLTTAADWESKSCRFLCNRFGLCYELFTGGFSGSLGFGRRSVLTSAETFDRSFWKVSFTSVRRFFTTFGCPILFAPVFQRLLRFS